MLHPTDRVSPFLPTRRHPCPLMLEGSQANISSSSKVTAEQSCRPPGRVCLSSFSLWEKPCRPTAQMHPGQQRRGGDCPRGVTTVSAAESRLCLGAGALQADLPSQPGSCPPSPQALPRAPPGSTLGIQQEMKTESAAVDAARTQLSKATCDPHPEGAISLQPPTLPDKGSSLGIAPVQ